MTAATNYAAPAVPAADNLPAMNQDAAFPAAAASAVRPLTPQTRHRPHDKKAAAPVQKAPPSNSYPLFQNKAVPAKHRPPIHILIYIIVDSAQCCNRVPIIYSEKTLNMAGTGRTPAYLAGKEQIIANAAQSFETNKRVLGFIRNSHPCLQGSISLME